MQKNLQKQIIALVFLVVGVCTLSLLVIGKDAMARRIEPPVGLAQEEQQAWELRSGNTELSGALDLVQGEKGAAAPVIEWQTVRVRSGDSVAKIFKRNALDATTLHALMDGTKHASLLRKIRPGQLIEFGRVNDHLVKVRYVQSKLKHVVYSMSKNGFVSEEVAIKPDTRRVFASGTIISSLSAAALSEGVPEAITMELANIFSWDIDFITDVRVGDEFKIFYEEHYLNGEMIGSGDILAASFTNSGTTYEAIHYTDKRGKSDHYRPNGKSLRRSFVRIPVDFTRISSPFNPKRLHPVFKTVRPHRGVDYAAATGTPIKASGDGVIQFAGWQRGYGNVVYIRHPNNIVTVYAHQSRIASRAKEGRSVRQGQIIGYVGQSGWATGPHLHYEFRVNNKHRDPMTVKLPLAAPLPKTELSGFKLVSRVMLAELERSSGTIVASSEIEAGNAKN